MYTLMSGESSNVCMYNIVYMSLCVIYFIFKLKYRNALTEIDEFDRSRTEVANLPSMLQNFSNILQLLCASMYVRIHLFIYTYMMIVCTKYLLTYEYLNERTNL